MTHTRTRPAPANIVSADYCIANGITPKAILSVAQFNEGRVNDRRDHTGRILRGRPECADIARRLRALAREVDEATGYFKRFRGRARPANDNRRQQRRAA